MQIDRLFLGPEAPATFRFDADVAAVFDDMVGRSVPFYQECSRLSACLAAATVRDGAAVHDLGSSTATTLLLTERILGRRPVRLVGHEPALAMLERAAAKLSASGSRIELCQATAQEADLEGAQVIIMNFTLQFIPPPERPALLRRLYEALPSGGLLILGEKLQLEGPELYRDCAARLYDDYKVAHGYSVMEIANKRKALEDVLVPWSADRNIEALREAGFGSCDTVLRWLNFAVFTAFKG